MIEVQPGPGRTGIAQPTNLVSFDYMLYANAKVGDDVVAKVVLALYDNAAALKASSPLWAEFDRAQMAKDIGVPYHPGAIKLYQEKGIWKR